MAGRSARASLILARKHLARAGAAAVQPEDWDDLSIYGFACLEIAVVAAATCLQMPVQPNHPSKLKVSVQLRGSHGLPDISTLLPILNDARKAAMYGDVGLPTLDATQVARDIGHYVEAVDELLTRHGC
jgi:hypothetical protein